MSVPKSAIPSYGLTHDLLNELTIVIGTCDLHTNVERTVSYRAMVLAFDLSSVENRNR